MKAITLKAIEDTDHTAWKLQATREQMTLRAWIIRSLNQSVTKGNKSATFDAVASNDANDSVPLTVDTTPLTPICVTPDTDQDETRKG